MSRLFRMECIEVQMSPEFLGLDGLRRIAARLAIPVIALGGVGEGNAASCLDAGACGVAVMSGDMGAADPQAAVAVLVERLKFARTTLLRYYGGTSLNYGRWRSEELSKVSPELTKRKPGPKRGRGDGE